jgi:hypothetical protein
VVFGGRVFDTITVADTGTGMSFNDLDRNCLVIGTASRKKEVEACDYEPAARRLNSRRAPSRSAGTRQIITPATATQQASTMSNSALPSPPSGLKPNSFSIQSMSFSPRYAICFTLAALHLRGKRFDLALLRQGVGSKPLGRAKKARGLWRYPASVHRRQATATRDASLLAWQTSWAAFGTRTL